MARMSPDIRLRPITPLASEASGDDRCLTFCPTVLREIRDHAARAAPEEACGGLLGQARPDGSVYVHAVLPLVNDRRDKRARRYLVGPHQVLELERIAKRVGLEIVGWYHSHPEAPAVPSEFDREHAWPWYVYLIVAAANGLAPEVSAWRLANDRRRFHELTVKESLWPEVNWK